MNEPSTGRIVHYVCPESKNHRAAIISDVHANNVCCLTVFPPGSDSYTVTEAHYCPDATPGTWHWPERT